MKTTVNVMGIQAVSILERIADTLKAVLRVGKENRSVQVISDGKETASSSRLEVFTAEDPVFPEERVVSEIPRTVWSNAFLVAPHGLVDKSGAERAKGANITCKKMNKHSRAKKRTAGRATHLTLVKSAPAERGPVREIRDLRSSPSPPKPPQL
ncbi:hypothetical protein ACFSO0_05250 [Brevibacillus sp. GCM10020057]|uniref:hypothetical protein n=1 Tax=Brevibacillus sp. GCM10020057 TaxID=3317327 RepID=UPI00363CED2E